MGAIDIALHTLTEGFLPSQEESSMLVQRFGLGPVALTWGIASRTRSSTEPNIS